jgi:hypothetical protein
VDQFNTLGLGANVPINTGNQSEGLLVLKDGKWVVLRVPYPMGFYTKWLDGRIDDPTPAGRGAGSGPRSAPARPSTWRAGRGHQQGDPVPAPAGSAGEVVRRARAIVTRRAERR